MPAVDVETTADVWGGTLSARAQIWGGTLSTRGDLSLFSDVVTNMYSDSGLIPGQTYLARGPGLLPQEEGDTYLTYQGGLTGILSNGAVLAAVGSELTLSSTEGRSLIYVDRTFGLVSGQEYGITGPGIPQGTTFTYDGSTTLSVSQQATTTAKDAEVRISSPTGRSILKIASTAGLTVGQTYSVFAQGVPPGTLSTFTGDEAMVMLSDATVSGQGIPVILSKGTTYPDGGAFDLDAHLRYDLTILSVEIGHSEGDFPTMALTVRNLGQGLLNPDRQFWCWLSWFDGASVVPLFHGRLLGMPSDLQGEVVKLEFQARPEDYTSQKLALAASMKVAPYWDPVLIAERVDDPDTVLEARPERWHIDRLTLAVSTSNIIEGEDGTLTVGESDHTYADMTWSYTAVPLNAMNVSATVTWDQVGIGDVDITQEVWQAFANVGSVGPFPVIATMTGDGLKNSWPASGASAGGGWSVGDQSSIVQADWHRTGRYAVRYVDRNPAANAQQDVVTTSNSAVGQVGVGLLGPLGGDIDSLGAPHSLGQPYFGQFPPTNTTFGLIFAQGEGYQMAAGYKVYDVLFDLSQFAFNLVMHYEATRKRSETVMFRIVADVQAVQTEPGASAEETLSLSSEFVSQTVDPGGAVPIGDIRRNTYFKTDRGQVTFKYILLLCRAKMLSRARCAQFKVKVSWPFAVSLGLSCRKSITLMDRRLPGGQVTGKVTSYQLKAAAGAFEAELQFDATVGRATEVVADAGAPVYANPGYMSPGYQATKGGRVELLASELNYQNFSDFVVIDDDGVDFFNMTPSRVLLNVAVLGGFFQQKGAIDEAIHQTYSPDPVSALKLNPTRVEVDLVPVTGGSFVSNYTVMVSKLSVPKTLDLEAV